MATLGGVHHCPKAVPDLGVEEGTFEAEKAIGLRLKRARNLAKRHGCTIRVVRSDGEWLPAIDDFRANRINVEVEDQRITRIRDIG